MTDPRGTVTSYAYDPMNRRTQTIQAYGTALAATTTTIYDLAGNTVSVTDLLGTVTSYGYDALNRKVTQIDGLGTSLAQTMTTVYDSANNVVQTINAQGRTTTMTYDAQNRQTSAQDPNGNLTTTVYNALNKIASVDGQGDRTTFGYDALNRQVTVTNALGNVTTTVYDANNNQVAVVDADGNRTTMVYDPLNRETQMTDPLNHSATYAYDLAGNQTSTTDRDGNIINSSYDALNRLTTAIWIQGGVTVNTLAYSYDGDNNQLTASNNAGTYTMAYNALNQKTSEQEPFGAVLTMTYDALGDRTQVLDSFGGTTTDTYDSLHRLATIQFGGASQTPLRVDMTYTALNQLATMIRYSNLAGTTTVGLSAYGYDAGGRMTSLQQLNGSGSKLENYTYTYDHADRVTAEILNGSATSYAYDTTNQLTTVINSSGTTTYSYDATGNRTMAGYQTGTGNELLNDGTWTYTYDSDGNLLKMSRGPSANTWTYGYADNGQMLWAKDSATDGGTVLALVTYAYDAHGNRLEQDLWTQSGNTTTVTRFAYDGKNVWADLNGGNALQVHYVDGNALDQLIAREATSGTAAWYLTDRQTSVRNLIDGSSHLEDTITYDAFGTLVSETAPAAGDRYKYAGREYDATTGLLYNRARYYSSVVGRWLTNDPLSFAGGVSNLYEYADNSPVNFHDPSGLQYSRFPNVVSNTDVPAQPSVSNFLDDFEIFDSVDASTGAFSDDSGETNPYNGNYGFVIGKTGASNKILPANKLLGLDKDLYGSGVELTFEMLDATNHYMNLDHNWHWIQFISITRQHDYDLSFVQIPNRICPCINWDVDPTHPTPNAGHPGSFPSPNFPGLYIPLNYPVLDGKYINGRFDPYKSMFYDEVFTGLGTGNRGTRLVLGDAPCIWDIFKPWIPLDKHQVGLAYATDYLVYWGRPVFEVDYYVAYGWHPVLGSNGIDWEPFYGPPVFTGHFPFSLFHPELFPEALRHRFVLGFGSAADAIRRANPVTGDNTRINPGFDQDRSDT